MPFKIIRNDLTKVMADAIVNTANPRPVFGGGTDTAIYMAAGAKELLEARKNIGKIARGEVAVTPAFNLKAQYILHTVGPKWIDGMSGEFAILRSCYEQSLYKALELNCNSIAFPLISTGSYGFPKDIGLQIAIDVFRKFLLEHDLEITLVVFDKDSFQLSSQFLGEIDSYIDANYVEEYGNAEYNYNFGRKKYARLINSFEHKDASSSTVAVASACLPKVKDALVKLTLEEQLNNRGASFHTKLFELIDAAKLDNKDVWKRANMDRKLFSKIQCNSTYHPNKKTVLALCLALQLDIEQAKDLLARAEWAFSPNSKLDLIVQKAILDRRYDIIELNAILFQYTNETL